MTSTLAPSRSPRYSDATATAADGIDTGWREIPVSVRTRLPDSTACLNIRDNSCGAVSSRTAACHASRTWPRISLSPTIIESRPAATEKRCATAASS